MIRLPLQKIHQDNVTGTSSSSIAWVSTVLDMDSVVVKLTSTLAPNSGSLDIFVQTSDDGGTTYYDLCHFPTVGSGGAAVGTSGTISNASALWMVLPLQNGGNAKSVTSASSLGLGAIGANYAGGVSGLPILSSSFRTNYSYTGSITSANWTLTYYACNQSGVGY